MAEVTGARSKATRPSTAQPSASGGMGSAQSKKRKAPDWLSMLGQGMSAQMGGNVTPYTEETYGASLGARAGRAIQRQQAQSVINNSAVMQARDAWLRNYGRATGSVQQPVSIWQRAVAAIKPHLGTSTYVPGGGVPNPPTPETVADAPVSDVPVIPETPESNRDLYFGIMNRGAGVGSAQHPEMLPPPTGFGTSYGNWRRRGRGGGGGGGGGDVSNPWINYMLGLNNWNI